MTIVLRKSPTPGARNLDLQVKPNLVWSRLGSNKWTTQFQLRNVNKTCCSTGPNPWTFFPQFSGDFSLSALPRAECNNESVLYEYVFMFVCKFHSFAKMSECSMFNGRGSHRISSRQPNCLERPNFNSTLWRTKEGKAIVSWAREVRSPAPLLCPKMVNTVSDWSVYNDGNLIENADHRIWSGTFPQGSGRLVIGKRRSDDESAETSSVKVDELVFWNDALTDQEVLDLYNNQ